MRCGACKVTSLALIGNETGRPRSYSILDNRLEVRIHVEDPGAFTTPWDAVMRYRRVEPGRAENDVPFNPVSSSTVAGPKAAR